MQTSYSAKLAPAFAGMKADLRDDVVESNVLEGATPIPFGVGVVKGTANDQVKLPSATSDKVTGIAIHTHSYFNQDLSGTAGIPVKGQVNKLRRGECWVVVETNVVDGDPVFCRCTAKGGNTQLGRFRNDADPTAGPVDTAVSVPEAKFRSTATAGGLALIEINLP